MTLCFDKNLLRVLERKEIATMLIKSLCMSDALYPLRSDETATQVRLTARDSEPKQFRRRS